MGSSIWRGQFSYDPWPQLKHKENYRFRHISTELVYRVWLSFVEIIWKWQKLAGLSHHKFMMNFLSQEWVCSVRKWKIPKKFERLAHISTFIDGIGLFGIYLSVWLWKAPHTKDNGCGTLSVYMKIQHDKNKTQLKLPVSISPLEVSNTVPRERERVLVWVGYNIKWWSGVYHVEIHNFCHFICHTVCTLRVNEVEIFKFKKSKFFFSVPKRRDKSSYYLPVFCSR